MDYDLAQAMKNERAIKVKRVATVNPPQLLDVIKIDDERTRGHLDRIVRGRSAPPKRGRKNGAGARYRFFALRAA
ncbi:MAG: hypothetical protein KGJ78_10930 [Alphaproteobacteria bacterium]|nr:hypothetical protein [Alphaproteobacteria bacterium]